MKKTTIDIADLMPESIIQEIRNHLDLYVKGIEAINNKPVIYSINLGVITFELDMKKITTNIDYIKASILSYFNLFSDEVYRKGKGSRRRELAYARYLTIYFICNYSQLTLKEISKEVGGYDHSTMIHAKKTIRNLRAVDKSVRYDVEKIEQMINKKLMGL